MSPRKSTVNKRQSEVKKELEMRGLLEPGVGAVLEVTSSSSSQQLSKHVTNVEIFDSNARNSLPEDHINVEIAKD